MLTTAPLCCRMDSKVINMLPGKEKTQQYGLLDCLGQVKCHTEQVGSTAWSNVNQIHYFSFIIVSLLHEDNMTFLYHPQTAHSKQEVVSLGILMSKETVACPLEVRKEHIQALTPPLALSLSLQCVNQLALAYSINLQISRRFFSGELC